MNSLAAIHVAKRDLKLDDDTYRDVLERVTGKRSAKGMGERDVRLVLDEFRRLGWQSKAARKGLEGPLDGPYARKLQALWIAGWNLGVVRDRRDNAMLAFIKRQTGIESTRFLRDAADARRAIEALKDWMHREGGVDWSTEGLEPASPDADPRSKVLWAQFERLVALGAFKPFAGGLHWSDIEAWAWRSQKVRCNATSRPHWSDETWQSAMNAAGNWLRYAKKKAAA